MSIDDTTGYVVRIEKIDEKTGKPRELTTPEYATAYTQASSASPYYATYAAALSPPMPNSAMQAYFRGILDYVRAITGLR